MGGGIVEWSGRVAHRPPERGLPPAGVFDTLEAALRYAYAMEETSAKAYRALCETINDERIPGVFETLILAEEEHKVHLRIRYEALGGPPNALEADAETFLAEGGLSPEELIRNLSEHADDRLALLEAAMGMETDALDLYLVLAERYGDDPNAKALFTEIAAGERAHLKQLGELVGQMG